MISSSEAVATALINALNASGLATFKRNRFPQYEIRDLGELKADVMLPAAYSVSANDAASVVSEIEVSIILQKRVEKDDAAEIEELALLLDKIARYLWDNEIDGLGLPSQPSTVGILYEELNDGHFVGGVGVTYQIFYDEG